MSGWGDKVSRLLGNIASQLGASLERPLASVTGQPGAGQPNTGQPNTGQSPGDPVPAGAFQLALSFADALWSEQAELRLVAGDGTHVAVPVAQAARAGDARCFVFGAIAPGVTYHGEMHDGEAIDEIFGPVELHRLLQPGAEPVYLPPPRPDLDAPALEDAVGGDPVRDDDEIGPGVLDAVVDAGGLT